MIDFSTQVLGFDFETQGTLDEYMLQPWRIKSKEAWISAVAFTRGDSVQGVLYPNVDTIKAVLTKAVENNLYVCGWNVSFDCGLCTALGLEDLAYRVKWLDSMLLWRHAVVEPEGDDVPSNKRKSYSLESAVKEFFPAEADFKDFKNFQTRDPEQLKLLLHRCKEDTRTAVKLGELFWGMLKDRQQQAALIEAQCIPQVAHANIRGIKASKEKAEALRDRLIKDGEEALAELVKHSPEVAAVNLGSPKQLADLLFKTWRLPIHGESKKTGAPTTDKNALYELAFIDPRAKLLKVARESKNNCTKYAAATIKSLDYNGDGFVRPPARIFSTYSSRMTYSSSQTRKSDKEAGVKSAEYPIGVALHQWKRGKDFRRLLQPPEGYDLHEYDFAGQEFRWMAVASGDETMLSLCAPGEDAHSFMGAQIAGIDYRDLIARHAADDPVADQQRKLGKFSNLSFQYRVGPKKGTQKARTDYEMDVDEMFIKQIIAKYKEAYRGVPKYWETQIMKCRTLGYAETFAGRRVQLKGPWVGRDAWGMESSAINYRIQGTGGDQKYLGLAVLRNILPMFGGYFYYELHDGLFVIIPKDKSLQATEVIQKALSNLPYEKYWGIKLPIKFPVDCKISSESWGDLKAPPK